MFKASPSDPGKSRTLGPEHDPKRLSAAGLASQCAQETDRFLNRRDHDPRYCFELFRRAIEEGSEQAWKLLFGQYRSLVSSWAKRHRAFPTCGEEAEYVVNRAFERMWSALTPATGKAGSPSAFAKFPDLKSLLRYLQMCVHSVIIDLGRRAGPPLISLEDLDPVLERVLLGQQAGAKPYDNLQREQFWQALALRLKSDQELRVLSASFLLGLKPREILAQYPEEFGSIREVYRIKENLLARLRRDAELEEILVGDA
jgi:hypothetical protein